MSGIEYHPPRNQARADGRPKLSPGEGAYLGVDGGWHIAPREYVLQLVRAHTEHDLRENGTFDQRVRWLVHRAERDAEKALGSTPKATTAPAPAPEEPEEAPEDDD